MNATMRGVVCALMLSGCAAHAIPHTGPHTPGFWLGLWHGSIAPIAFLISLFNPHVAVYAIPNSGGWYDFGFLLGLGIGLGGGGGAARGYSKR